jgi:chromosome segregation ATPase
VQLQQAHAERDNATAQAAAAKSEASALQQQLQEAAQQLADARLQLAEAAESRDAMQHQLHSLQAALQDMASDKDAAFTRLGQTLWQRVACIHEPMHMQHGVSLGCA